MESLGAGVCMRSLSATMLNAPAEALVGVLKLRGPGR